MKNLLLLFFFIPVLLSAQQNLPLNHVQYLDRSIADDSEKIVISNISEIDLNFFRPEIISPIEPQRTKSKSLSSILVRKIKKESC